MKCDIFSGVLASVEQVQNNSFFCQLSTETQNFVPRVPFQYVQQQFVSVGVNVKQFYTDNVQDKLDNVVRAGEMTLEDFLVKARVVGEKLGHGQPPLSHPEACGSDSVSIGFEGKGEFEPTTLEISEEVVSGSHEQVNIPAPLPIESQEDSVTVTSTNMNKVSTSMDRAELEREEIEQLIIEQIVSGSHERVNIPAPLSIESPEYSVAVASTNMNRAEDAKSDIVALGSQVDSSISSKSEHTCLDTGDVPHENLTLIIQDGSNDTFESAGMAMTDCPTKEGVPSASLEDDESCVLVDVKEPFLAPEKGTEPVQKYFSFTPFALLRSAQKKKQKKAASSEDLNEGSLNSLNQHSCQSEPEPEWVII